MQIVEQKRLLCAKTCRRLLDGGSVLVIAGEVGFKPPSQRACMYQYQCRARVRGLELQLDAYFKALSVLVLMRVARYYFAYRNEFAAILF